ncbi:hypothetical protein P8452_14294 [Trifolium repens]|nr:hypothetical protein P8452_14294 [Trifolium repens]
MSLSLLINLRLCHSHILNLIPSFGYEIYCGLSIAHTIFLSSPSSVSLIHLQLDSLPSQSTGRGGDLDSEQILGICMKQGLGNFMHQMFELWIHELGSIVISPRGYRAEWLNGKNILMEIRSISFREGRRDRTVWLAAPSNCYSVKSAYGFLSEASSLGTTSLYKKGIK